MHGEPVVQQQKGRFRVCLEGPAPLSKQHRAVSLWLDSAAEADAVMAYGLQWLDNHSVQPPVPVDDVVLQHHCELLGARIDMAVSAANGPPWRCQPELRCKTCGFFCSPSSCPKCEEAAQPWVYVKARQPRWRDVGHHDILGGRLSRYHGVSYDKVCRRYETKVFKQSMGSYCTEEEAARAVDLGYQFVGLDPPNASDFPDDGIENVAIEVEGAFEVYLARIAAVRENPLLAKPAKRCRAVAADRAWCSAAVKAKSRDVMWAVQKLVLTRAARDDLLQVWLWLRSRSRAAITLRDVAGLIFDVRVQLFESGGDVVRAFVRSAVGMGAQVTSLDAELGAFLRSEPTGMVPKEELHEWRDKTFSPYAWDPPST